MAKLYFLPRVALKAQDALLPLAWRLEAAVVRWTFRHLRRLPLEDAQGRAARWFRRIGPRTPVAQKLLRNLAILHPEAPLSVLKVEARDSFAALGQAVAERPTAMPSAKSRTILRIYGRSRSEACYRTLGTGGADYGPWPPGPSPTSLRPGAAFPVHMPRSRTRGCGRIPAAAGCLTGNPDPPG